MVRAAYSLAALVLATLEINMAGGATPNVGILGAINAGLTPLADREPTDAEDLAIRTLIGQLFEAPAPSAEVVEPANEATPGSAPLPEPVAVEPAPVEEPAPVVEPAPTPEA